MRHIYNFFNCVYKLPGMAIKIWILIIYAEPIAQGFIWLRKVSKGCEI